MAKKEVNKKKKKRVAEELAGIHIYKDDHNRYVYYDIFSKVGYVISNPQSYKAYSNRFILGVIAAILVYTFELGPWLAIGAGILAYGLMEFKFRSFLKKQTMLMNFQPKKRTPKIIMAASDKKGKILLRIVLFLAFAILIVLLAFVEEKYDIYMKAACILVGIGALYMSIFNVYALIYKNKNNIDDIY